MEKLIRLFRVLSSIEAPRIAKYKIEKILILKRMRNPDPGPKSKHLGIDQPYHW